MLFARLALQKVPPGVVTRRARSGSTACTWVEQRHTDRMPHRGIRVASAHTQVGAALSDRSPFGPGSARVHGGLHHDDNDSYDHMEQLVRNDGLLQGAMCARAPVRCARPIASNMSLALGFERSFVPGSQGGLLFA